MRVICPLSACSSYEKRDQFLAIVSDIAVVTEESEPQTLAYGWFQSTGDNVDIPNHYVRGFEVYEEEAALADVHRISVPYRKMRALVIPDKILERPTDLRFLQPAGGFLSRGLGTKSFIKYDHIDEESRKLVVVENIKSQPGMKDSLVKEIQSLASDLEEHNPEVGSFWILEYLPQYGDDGIKIFSTDESDLGYHTNLELLKLKYLSARIDLKIDKRLITRLRYSGVGFYGR